MPSFLTSAALLAGAASMAAAAPSKNPGHTFQAKQVATGKFMKNGAAAVWDAYNKYAHTGIKAPAGLQKMAAQIAAQQGTVSADPENPNYDIAYTCNTQVGSSNLRLDYDTGSSDLWVFGKETPKSQSTGHHIYTPGPSGKKLAGETWRINYGDMSSAGGVVYADKVVVGGVTATSQAVEAATTVADSFAQNTNQDGLMGLGFSHGRNGNTVRPDVQNTFFETVGPTLAQNLFTVDLKKGQAGTYDFGYIDQSKYTGSINYVPIDGSLGYWEFQAGHYATGQSQTADGTVGDSIMDTGTSLLLLAGNAASDYYSHVRTAQYDSESMTYTYSCSETLPDWYVRIGTEVYKVTSDYLRYGQADATHCIGGIQPIGGSLSIFGDIFMKHFFVVFDKTQSSPRMGIAHQS